MKVKVKVKVKVKLMENGNGKWKRKRKDVNSERGKERYEVKGKWPKAKGQKARLM